MVVTNAFQVIEHNFVCNYTDPFPDTDLFPDTDTDTDKGCQTTLTMEEMKKEACFMRTCVAELNELRKQLLNVQISEQSFREND